MAFNKSAWHVGFKWTIGDEDNPTAAICLDNTSKALHICDIEDATTDWNVSADSYPSVYIHDIAAPATDYVKIYHNGTNGIIDVDGTTVFTMSSSAWSTTLPLTTTSAIASTYTAGPALTITQATVGNDVRGFRELYTVATPAMADGYGVHEIDLTLSGTATGHISVTSTWLNIPVAASILASGNYVFLHNDGIYEHTDATITGAFIAFQKYSAILSDSDNTHLHIWNFNLTGKAITALIEVNNPAKLSFSAGTSHGNVQGTIPLYTTGLGSTMYVAVYNTQGAG